MAHEKVARIQMPENMDGSSHRVNAFRILSTNEVYIVDFLVYAEGDNEAILVSRLIVSPQFITALKDKLEEMPSTILLH